MSAQARPQNCRKHAPAQTVPWLAPDRVTSWSTWPLHSPCSRHQRVGIAPIECAIRCTFDAPVRARRSRTASLTICAVRRFGWQLS